MVDNGPSVTIGLDPVPDFGEDLNQLPWQNPLDALDVTRDGAVTPLDALAIINELTTPAYHQEATGRLDDLAAPDLYFDVNGDQSVSPVDALIVINRLNELAVEAQSAVAVGPPSFDFISVLDGQDDDE